MEDEGYLHDFSNEDLKSEAQVRLYNYWLGIREDGKIPSRSDIKPEDIPSVLSNIILLDYDEEEKDFSVRLIGTHCSHFLGEITGHKLSSSISFYKGLSRFKQCVLDKKPYFVTSSIQVFGKGCVGYSSVVLPLSSDGINVNMLILANDFS